MCTIFINVHSTTTWPHSLWSMSSIKVDFLPWIHLDVAVSTSGSRGPSSTEVLPVAVYIVRRPEAGRYRSGCVKALNTQMFKLFKMYSHLLSSELLPSLGECGSCHRHELKTELDVPSNAVQSKAIAIQAKAMQQIIFP